MRIWIELFGDGQLKTDLKYTHTTGLRITRWSSSDEEVTESEVSQEKEIILAIKWSISMGQNAEKGAENSPQPEQLPSSRFSHC